MSNIHAIAKHYGGEVSGGQARIPTIGHSKRDRGVAIKPEASAPDGLLVHCFNKGDPIAEKDRLRADGFLPPLASFEPKPRMRFASDNAPKVERQPREVGVTHFEYADEFGEVLCRKVRTDTADGKRFNWQHSNGNGGWSNGKGGHSLFYRLADLIAAKDGEPVYMAEGEQKADKLASWGLVATMLKDLPSDLSPLAGRKVIILPDNDEPGAKLASKAAESLKGVASSIITLELPRLPDKGDVIDWDGDKAELESLVQSAFDGPPKAQIEPVDLFGAPEAPELPEGLLPPIIEEYARVTATQMGTDPAGSAMSALAVCAAVIRDEIELKPKQHGGWTEQARIWVGLVGDPSARKSPVINGASAPIKNLDAEMARKNGAAVADWIESGAKKAGKPKPDCPRLRLEDGTTEAVQEVARQSPRGILVLQDELSGFFGRIEKYGGAGSSADRAFWLQSYNGGQYAVDRISRGSFIIPNLSVTMLGGIQPEAIRKVMSDAADDGLIQRFMPIILRKAGPDRDEPAPDVADGFARLVDKLNHMNPPNNGAGIFQPFIFSADARAVRERMSTKHLELQAVQVTSPKLATAIGKYDGLFVRLCLLWHCIEHAGKDAPDEVSAETAERVAAFLHGFILKHAVSFYTDMLGVSDDGGDVQKAAGFILAKRLETLTIRDLTRSRGGKSGLTKPETQSIIEKLESIGWLQADGSAKPKWIVNPRVHEKFAKAAEAEKRRRADCHQALKELAQ